MCTIPRDASEFQVCALRLRMLSKQVVVESNTLAALHFIVQPPSVGLKLSIHCQDSIYRLTTIVYSHSPDGSSVCWEILGTASLARLWFIMAPDIT